MIYVWGFVSIAALVGLLLWLAALPDARPPGPSIPSCPVCGKTPVYSEGSLFCFTYDHSVAVRLDKFDYPKPEPGKTYEELERAMLNDLWMETFPRVRISK
jgi:hypothetical protein